MSHAPPPGDEGDAPSIEATEALLADWFGAEVVLTGSGRAGLHLALADLGLDRYHHRVALCPKTSACVMEVVVRHGFPVDPSAGASGEAAIVVHQYGHRQRWRPDGPIVEDICHAFFATPDSGARRWAGGSAVFSLTKAFSLAGMAGGIVTRDRAAVRRLRARIADAPLRCAEAARRERGDWRTTDPRTVERAQFARLVDPSPDRGSLAGMPRSLDAIRAAGRRRADIVARLIAARPAAYDDDWATSVRAAPPFALPLFGEAEMLARIDRALAAEGIAAGCYVIDRRRDAAGPDWTPALLLPCHQYLTESQVDGMIRAVAA